VAADVITILFTDIVDSTTLVERLGDRGWVAVLRAHNAIVRKHAEHHGGVEVKATGDGFMLAFSRPRSAVACAAAIQRAITEQSRRHGGAQLRLRVGIHTGTAIEVEGDLHGRDVVVAARLCAAAAGGEILASAATVRRLARPARFGCARQLTLKGLSGSRVVHSVLWRPRTCARCRAYPVKPTAARAAALSAKPSSA
jgi:class 3 adenylate cyclase